MVRKVRIGLCRNDGKDRGRVLSGVVVAPTYDDILRVAANKLKLKKSARKTCRLYVYRRTRLADAGTELPRKGSLLPLLCDDTIVCVATRGFIARDGSETGFEAADRMRDAKALGIPRTPRWPWPGCSAGREDGSRHETSERAEGISTPELTSELPPGPKQSAEMSCEANRIPASADQHHARFPMNGQFPVFHGDVRADLRACVSGCPAFSVRDHGAFLSFDYRNANSLAELFPDPSQAPRGARERWMRAARRECRGLLVCSRTGRVLARRFHKFFNIDERDETRISTLRLRMASGAWAAHKIDGMLASALLLPFDETSASYKPDSMDSRLRLVWATRAAVNRDIESFITRSDAKDSTGFASLARGAAERGRTALFEWCPAGRSVGVIRHGKPQLVLLAIRDNTTGAYATPGHVEAQAREHRVPVAGFLDLKRLAVGGGPGAYGGGESAARVDKSMTRSSQLDQIVTQVAAWEGKEGVVLCLGDQHQTHVKVKSTWYTAMASAAKQGGGVSAAGTLVGLLRARPTLSGVPARALWGFALSEGKDDALPAALRLLAQGGREVEAHAGWLKCFCGSVSQGTARLHGDFDAWGAQIRGIAATHVRGKSHVLRAAAAMGHSVGWPVATLRAFCAGNSTSNAVKLRVYLRSLCRAEAWGPLSKLMGVQWTDQGPAVIDQQPNHPSSDGRKPPSPQTSAAQTSVVRPRAALRASGWHVFCDLDGVLADFVAGFRRVSGGCDASALSKDDMWRRVQSRGDFFRTLSACPCKDKLWDFLCGGAARRLGQHETAPRVHTPPIILTGIPRGKFGKVARKHKRTWCKEHLSPAPAKIIACAAHEKSLHSGPGCILVDDSADLHREAWERKGGIFIHHKGDAAETIRALQCVFRGEFQLGDMKHECDSKRDGLETDSSNRKEAKIRISKADVAMTCTQLRSVPPKSSHVRAHYAGIFLTRESRKRLLSRYAPRHCTVYCDHVTLCFEPQASYLSALQVGRRVVLSTSRELHDGRAQTVLVRTPKGELGAADDAPILKCLLPKGAHITISCARGTSPTYSNVLIAKSTDEVIRPDSGPISVKTMAVDPAADAVNIPSPTPISSMQTPSDSKPVRIEGVVGVLVKLDAGTRAALAALPVSVVQRIMDLSASRVPGARVDLRRLTGAERRAVHLFCEANGLQSESAGPKSGRVLSIRVPQQCPQGHPRETKKETNKPEEERALVLVPQVHRGMQYASKDPKAARQDGQLGPNGAIDWAAGLPARRPSVRMLWAISQPGEVTPYVTILRGLPGAGKSTLARSLAVQARHHGRNVQICSADSYFDQIRRKFDAARLGEAHDACRAAFRAAIEAKDFVVIDNTNSTLKEYAYYKRIAKKKGYGFVVVEIMPLSDADAVVFRARGRHAVPERAVHRMRVRWEYDPDAVRLAPFVATSKP